MKMPIIIALISTVSSVLPFSAGLYSLLKKRGDRALSIFSMYLIIAFVTEIILLVYALGHKNNLVFTHIFLPIEYMMLVAYLIYCINLDHKKILIAVVSLGFAVILYDKFIKTEFSSYGTLAFIVESMILFGLSIEGLIDSRDEKKYFGRVIIVIGIVTYFGTNSLVFPFFNDHNLPATMNTHSVVNIMANIIYMLGIIWYEYK